MVSSSMSRSLSMKVAMILSLIYTGSCQSDRRQDITRLSPEALNQFRDNVRRVQQSGEWVNLAADHGIPNQYCPHGNLRFLIWHRRQMARIEEILGQKLPYWDWTRTNGIPEPCRNPTYTDASGIEQPNPLYSGPKFGGESTTRQPIPDFNIGSLQSQEQMAMGATRFEDFSNFVEGAHNDIHGDIGGDMNTLDYSAFDPIFWLHHCNVDRIWYRWQRRNRFAMYPDEARGEMQDSIGIFMGEDVLQDLSGWIPGGRQPAVRSSQTPTMSSSGSVRGTGPNADAGTGPGGANSPDNNRTSSGGPASGNNPGPDNNPQPSFQTLATSIGNLLNLPRFQTLADDDKKTSEQGHHHSSPSMTSSTNTSAAGDYLPSLKSVRHQLHSLQAPLEIVTTIEDDPNLRTSVEEPNYQPQSRSVMVMKGMEAGADPLRVDIYFSGQLIGWVQTFGMGRSNMSYKIDRFVDITSQAQHCAHDEIKPKLQFRVTNQRTGQVDLGKTYELELKNMIF